MNQTAADILNGPDYFYCERYRCRMKKAECVRRQKAPKKAFGVDYTDMICKDCGQGAAIMAEFDKAERLKKKAKRTRDIIPEGKMAKNKECIVDGCENERFVRGLCKYHYFRWNKGVDQTINPLAAKYQKGEKVQGGTEKTETKEDHPPVPTPSIESKPAEIPAELSRTSGNIWIITGWATAMIIILLSALCVWDYMHTKMTDHEQRITELESQKRPLIVVDKYSEVYLNGENVVAEEMDD